MGESELAALGYLLKASSKDTVEKCLSIAFVSRNDVTSECSEFLQAALELDSLDEGDALRTAILACIQASLATGSLEGLGELFNSKGQDVNPKLMNMIGQIIKAKMEEWREAAAFSRVTLPKYIDVDWAVNITKASSQVSRMRAPVALVELQIEEPAQTTDSLPQIQKVPFELSESALATMLDGLGKIRDQLSSMG